MTRHHQLKNEARRAEQRADWARAIELYKSAVRLGDERDSDVDIGIYNRIGDLYLRLGDAGAAVEYYEQAADLYASHGLHTSAIALCNKILRIAPDRDEVYGRLARLHAGTGLMAEARSAFLKFADHMRRTERLSEALEAVQDLVSLTGDEELRTAFADQLVEAGLAAQAVAQLRLVYQARVSAGRNAQDIRERILDLDPDADPVRDVDPPPARATATPDPPALDTSVESFEALPEPAAVDDLDEIDEPTPVDVSPSPQIEESTVEVTIEEPVLQDAPPLPSPDEPEPAVEVVLDRFRSQVRDIVADADHTVHHDLGVAYMDMGLFEDAMAEFSAAAGAPGLEASARALLEQCQRSRSASETEPSEPEPDAPAAGSILPLAAETGAAPDAPSDVVSVSPDSASSEASRDDEEELADMLFQARLSQHRVRAASEAGRADHGAHLDLGCTYERMGLATEAVRDLVIAASGPPAVREDALAALERVSAAEGIEAASLREVLSCLMGQGREDVALRLGRQFLSRAGIPEKDRQLIREQIPELEPPRQEAPHASHGQDGGHAAAERPIEAAPGDDGEDGVGTSVPPPETPGAEARNSPEPEDEALTLMGEAEGLRAAGRMDEAEAHYYRALELFEKRRDAVNAIRAVDRLLGLRPDDVVLHHQKNELAIMLNDRELLVSSYLDLAACLRRQNGIRSARTVYGRILDLDPGNAEARAGIAAVDADQLARERRRRETVDPSEEGTKTEPERETDAVEAIPATIDELFADLKAEDEPATPGEPPDYDSHFELAVAFQQMEMWEEAARELKVAVQGMPDPLAGYELLGKSLLALRRFDEARRTLTVAVAQPGSEDRKVEVIFLLGVAHLRSGDREAARSSLERVVRIDPSRTDAAQLLSTLPA